MDLQTVARALGGEISGGQVLAPGPGHSAQDRSLAVKIDANAPDGFIIHSFAADDAIACKDYVREKLGLGFKSNGKQHKDSDFITAAVMAAARAQGRDSARSKVQFVHCSGASRDAARRIYFRPGYRARRCARMLRNASRTCRTRSPAAARRGWGAATAAEASAAVAFRELLRAARLA